MTSSLLDWGSGVPEWEKGDHFWNEAEQERQFEGQLEVHAASHRKSLGDPRQCLYPNEQ